MKWPRSGTLCPWGITFVMIISEEGMPMFTGGSFCAVAAHRSFAILALEIWEDV